MDTFRHFKITFSIVLFQPENKYQAYPSLKLESHFAIVNTESDGLFHSQQHTTHLSVEIATTDQMLEFPSILNTLF